MLNNEEWETLLFSIRQKNCILFLGPNVSTLPNTKQPLIEAFANTLAQKLKEINKDYHIADPNDLAEVASLFVPEKGTMRLQLLIDNFYKQHINALNPTLEFLAKLPFYLIINTTPDNLITNAYKKIGADYDFAYYNFGNKQEAQNTNTTFNKNTSKPFIYNLFGSIEQTNSLVLTQKDQIKFAKQIDTPEWAIPPSIGRELIGDKIYLFVGFDFDTWYLRLLINALQKGDNNSIPTSFAIQKEEKILSPSAMVLFQKEFKLKFVDGTAANFAQALANKQTEPAEPLNHTTPKTDVINAVLLHHTPQDDLIKNDFLIHIKPIQRKYKLEIYDHTNAVLSTEIEKQMAQKLNTAKIIFILTTSDLVAADNFFDLYLPIIQKLNAPNHTPRTLIIPILAEACAWEIVNLNTYPAALPRNKLPIYSNGTANPDYWDATIEQIDQIISNFEF